MTFDLMWIDWWWSEKLFGIGFFSIKGESLRSLFALYWNDGELQIDVFWFRIMYT